LDIFINFNTGYYDKGLLVMERKRIAINYLKGWFWIDLIASFPYSWVISEEDDEEGSNPTEVLRLLRFLRFIRLLRLLRIFKLKKIFGKLETYLDFSPAVFTIIGFIKLSFVILFISHWIACVFHFVAFLELSNSPETWLTRFHVVDAPWYDRYIAANYFAVSTMITVGYGDLVPITTTEKLTCVVVMILSSGVFAYTMNRINYLLSGLETTSETYKHAL